MSDSLLRLQDLKVHFPLSGAWGRRRGELKAVDGVSLALYPGRTLALVGESGCGKSTLSRALTGLVPITDGALYYAGARVDRSDAKAFRALRRDIQMIFQDPLASLDPRMTVGQIVAEPLRHLRPDVPRAERRGRVAAMLERVGLAAEHINRYPHEFSGGQCQRIGIARALVVEPKVLICDEPVSALDVSIQARILALLAELQAEFDIALLFIAHDLAVVRQLADEVLVMYLGRTMEYGPVDTVFARPAHPYTRALLSAVPRADPAYERSRRRIALAGELPSPANPPSGCVFRTRCPWAAPDCGREVPALRAFDDARRLACLHAEAIAAGERPIRNDARARPGGDAEARAPAQAV